MSIHELSTSSYTKETENKLMLRTWTTGISVGYGLVVDIESNKVRIIMSQLIFMAPKLFSSLIVAEMSADAEYPFAAIMQGSAFIYPGSDFEN